MSFLIPLTNRGFSGPDKDNLLWRENNIYVMDNHRLALWCWFQEMKENQRYNLWHVDAHPDMSESALKYFHHDLKKMALDDYRTAWQEDIHSPLFRWDNYLEVFLKNYPEFLGQTYSSTHKVGSSKELSLEIKSFDLPRKMNEIFTEKIYLNDLPWIFNLDLDYFFSAHPQKLELFSNEYLQSLSQSLKAGLKNGMIAILTIALSPECCGSWEKAESILAKLDLTPGLKL